MGFNPHTNGPEGWAQYRGQGGHMINSLWSDDRLRRGKGAPGGLSGDWERDGRAATGNLGEGGELCMGGWVGGVYQGTAPAMVGGGGVKREWGRRTGGYGS